MKPENCLLLGLAFLVSMTTTGSAQGIPPAPMCVVPEVPVFNIRTSCDVIGPLEGLASSSKGDVGFSTQLSLPYPTVPSSTRFTLSFTEGATVGLAAQTEITQFNGGDVSKFEYFSNGESLFSGTSSDIGFNFSFGPRLILPSGSPLLIPSYGSVLARPDVMKEVIQCLARPNVVAFGLCEAACRSAGRKATAACWSFGAAVCASIAGTGLKCTIDTAIASHCSESASDEVSACMSECR